MTSIDVLRKALEALEAMEGIGALEDGTLGDHGGIPTAQKKCRRAITALRAELERMEAVEPVAWVVMNGVRRVALHLTSADASADRDRRQLSNDLSGNLTAHWVAPLYTAPIAPSIPAPTHEQIDEGWIQCGGSGSAYDAWHDGARWAYDLAAKRATVRAKCGHRPGF